MKSMAFGLICRLGWKVKHRFRLLFSAIFLVLICVHGAYGAQIANVKYIHDYIKKYTGITVPIKANATQAANIKYLLCAVDRANALAPATSFPMGWCDITGPLPAGNDLQAADTVSVKNAVDTYFNCSISGWYKASRACEQCPTGQYCEWGQRNACLNTPSNANNPANGTGWEYSGVGADWVGGCPILINGCNAGYHPRDNVTPNATCVRTDFDTTQTCPEVDPLDRDVYLAIADDPASFFSCSNSVPILMHCPPGLHFVHSLQVCDWPQNVAWCADSGYGNWPITYIKSGDYAENPRDVCHGCSPAIAATNGTNTLIEGNGQKCQYSYACNSGYIHALSGTTSDQNVQMTCQRCSNTPIRARTWSYTGTTDSATGLCNINITRCPQTDEQINENNTPNAHCMPPQTRTCADVAGRVDDLGNPATVVLARTDGITKFMTCENGKPVDYMDCPDGLHLNESLEVCDWPNNVGFCRDVSGCLNPGFITYPKDAVDSYAACGCDRACDAPNGTVTNGTVTRVSATVSAGQTCQYRYNCNAGYYHTNHGLTSTNKGLALTCSSCTNRPVYGSHVADWYYTYGATTATSCPIAIRSCPDGWFLSDNATALAACLPPAGVSCPSPLPQDSTVLIADPNDCTKFYSCGYDGPVPMDCPDGLYFNPNYLNGMVCDWPGNVQCNR